MSISVLMSVYKSEKPTYLSCALKSIWDDQTLKPDEIILVEDGPLGEGLLKVINDFKTVLGSKLKILVNNENLGLTKSLNRGLKIATGDYIARMDSDDISCPDRFEKQAKILDNDENVDIIGGSLLEFDSNSGDLGIRHYPTSHDEILKYIYKASPLAHPTVMMRRTIFTSGLKYDEKYRTSQDVALWFDAICKGYKLANLSEVTLKFRRDGDVYKRRSKQKAKNEFKIYINGIHRIYGLFTLKYLYPVARLIFRMMPISIVRQVYGSSLRSNFLQKSNS